MEHTFEEGGAVREGNGLESELSLEVAGVVIEAKASTLRLHQAGLSTVSIRVTVEGTVRVL